MSIPSPMNPPPPQKSSGGKVLLIIAIIGGVLLLGCAGVCGGVIFLGGRAAKQAGDMIAGLVELGPVMDQSMQAVLNDQQVKTKLGEPLAPQGIPVREATGEINPVHESFRFDVSGPNGTGKVTGHATKVEGSWKVTQITVEASDGEKIEVTPPSEPAMDVQFDTDMPDESAK